MQILAEVRGTKDYDAGPFGRLWSALLGEAWGEVPAFGFETPPAAAHHVLRALDLHGACSCSCRVGHRGQSPTSTLPLAMTRPVRVLPRSSQVVAASPERAALLWLMRTVSLPLSTEARFVGGC